MKEIYIKVELGQTAAESGGVLVRAIPLIQSGARVKLLVVNDDGFTPVWIVHLVFVGEELGCCLYSSGNWFITVNSVLIN